MMERCPFRGIDYLNCNDYILNDENRAVLQYEKAIKSINSASQKRGINIDVQIGSVVHNKCRKKYTQNFYIDKANLKRKNEESDTRVPILRSNQLQAFDYSTHCFLCDSIAVDENGKRQEDVSRVSTWNCQDSFTNICKIRGDTWAESVKSKIIFAVDLPAKDALYHHQCSTNFRNRKLIPKKHVNDSDSHRLGNQSGRPKDEERSDAFHLVVIDFLENNDETVTVSELIERMRSICGEPYSSVHMKNELEKVEGIYITKIGNEENMVTSKVIAAKVLSDFHSKRNLISLESEWKKEIMHAAAGLVKADIDNLIEDRNNYPDISDIGDIDKQLNYVPFYLKTFLREIFKCRKTDMDTRVAAIGQSIMQNYRPKTLIAPMQFALTMKVHDECPGLVKYLFKNGFSLSDDEAYLFKACAAHDCTDPFSLMDGKFGWIIGDNFDHNKITLTGHDTIHVMALMMAKTPSIDAPHKIPRRNKMDLKQKPLTRIEIRNIAKINTSDRIKYHSIPDVETEDNREHLDILWKLSIYDKPKKAGWQGYMTAITHGEHTGKASFHFLPMVDLDPNSWKCIYSVLMWGKDQCEKHDIVPLFTFDQPIWWNARQIKNQERDLNSVVLNLGAFHTDLSFIGSIGNIMKSSGLKQLLSLVYPENTVNQMLLGKAYSRALRGLFLIDAALNIFIIDNYFPKDDPNIELCLEMFNNTMKKLDENEATNDKEIEAVRIIFKNVKDKLKEYPTGQLWIQFMTLIDLLRAGLRAQRTNKFMPSLTNLKEKEPYFPASGHNNYAMSIHIFLYDMFQLKYTNPRAHKHFNDGFFFVRRSDRYWSALPSDLIIEQVLMASLKNNRSGITHGRGLSEEQRLLWLKSRPAFAHLKSEFDKLYKEDDNYINKELTNNRIKEDTDAINEIIDYLKEHNPFRINSQDLVDISTGMSYPNANAHKALEIGNNILKNMDGVEVAKYKFRKAERIRPMGEKVMVGKEELFVDPQLLYQRMLIIANSYGVDLVELFKHELSLYPPSLFKMNGDLRYADDKAILIDFIANLCALEPISLDEDNIQIQRSVIDMGSMLHGKVMWKKGDTYGKIVEYYVKQAQLYPHCVAVFDGYSDSSSSTKYLTQLKRSTKVIPAHTVELVSHLPFNCDSKESFLANATNKQSFINMLSDAMKENNIKVDHAKGDADQLIAKTAIDLAVDYTTQVLAEDTDIFQLLVSQLSVNSKGLYMVTDKRNAKHPCLDINAIRSQLGNEFAQYLPLLHAISGCDTTSKPYGIGKTTVLKKRNEIIKVGGPFLSPNATPDEIDEAGRKIFCLIYNEEDEHFNLDNIRKKKIEKSVIKSIKSVNVQILPPTNSAAKYHFYRVYYQVQLWLGNNNLKATDWGWNLINGKLVPKRMDTDPAPQSLMKIMKCGCTLYCDNNLCTCKKYGWFCTELCDNCNSGNCTNVDISNILD